MNRDLRRLYGYRRVGFHFEAEPTSYPAPGSTAYQITIYLWTRKVSWEWIR